MQKILRIKHHTLSLLFLALLGKASPAHAFEVGAGLTAVEEGDDRIRPGVGLHVGFNDFYAGRIYYYGREYGPVKEQTFLASFMRRWSVFKSNTVTAGFGGVLMDERTALTFDGEDTALNETENNYNLGAAMGIAWSLPKSSGPLYASVAWDAHIFPAGIGGIFLSTGRKQTITLIIGTSIR